MGIGATDAIHISRRGSNDYESNIVGYASNADSFAPAGASSILNRLLSHYCRVSLAGQGHMKFAFLPHAHHVDSTSTLLFPMGGPTMHSFVSCLMHVVFSTKERRPWIASDVQDRLWPYLGGIARENKMKALKVGGVEDHIHMLLSLPSTLDIAKAVQLLKGNSSKWIHETFPKLKPFEWQEGYGAFSIGVSGVEDTIRYIENQAEHHRKQPFNDELKAFLKKHALEYEEWMLD